MLKPSNPTAHPDPDSLAILDYLIQDLFKHQSRLSTLIDQAEDSKTWIPLLSVYSRNAVHLARLLREQQTLAQPSPDSFLAAMGPVLDQLSEEWGIEL